MSEWLEAGKKAPDFTLAADDGTKIKLSSLRGGPVMLYFYPKDNTPGCTTEACSFRDRQSELTDLEVNFSDFMQGDEAEIRERVSRGHFKKPCRLPASDSARGPARNAGGL